jgi:hypothetical protein
MTGLPAMQPATVIHLYNGSFLGANVRLNLHPRLSTGEGLSKEDDVTVFTTRIIGKNTEAVQKILAYNYHNNFLFNEISLT